MPSWTRLLALCLACLGPLLAARAADAQTLVIANLERKDRNNYARLQETEINQADCLANDTLTFTLTLSQVSNQSLQVWEGTSCNIDTNRDSSTDACNLVAEGDSTDNVVEIKTQDLLRAATSNQMPIATDGGTVTDAGAAGAGAVADAGAGDAGIVMGDPSVCMPTGGTGYGMAQLYFLLVTGDMAVANPPPAMVFTYDLLGPDPPTNLELAVGEDSLIVTYDESTSNNADIVGYNLYCERGTCSPTTLVPGGFPPTDPNFDCGSVAATTEEAQTDNSLTNGEPASVALAARDKFGNAGRLSESVCGTPQLVTGFYEAYRAGGGKGGGAGICSFSGPARLGFGALTAAAVIALAAALRRSRRRR
jgi:hypothetical protein